jgi:hypothetical protein
LAPPFDRTTDVTARQSIDGSVAAGDSFSRASDRQLPPARKCPDPRGPNRNIARRSRPDRC